MRKLSVRPVLTFKGRTFKGLRGWSGKPLHPPLTDVPVAAYVLAAVFDVISAVAGKDQTWARELWHAGTSVVIGLLVSVGATFGGSLVYEYGFNVETAGDHPVWHKSDTDVFPGQHD